MDVNKNCMLNRWVPPSVAKNDNLYVLSSRFYEEHYCVCAQKDIVKHSNYIQEYKYIQSYLLQTKELITKHDLVQNRAFNVYDILSESIYECRILYAYFEETTTKEKQIHWRCYIDEINMNLILSTFLIKKCMFSTYSNYIIKLNLKEGGRNNHSTMDHSSKSPTTKYHSF